MICGNFEREILGNCVDVFTKEQEYNRYSKWSISFL
jgi:hypothetical protein